MSKYTVVSLYTYMSLYEFTKLCTKDDGSRLEAPQIFNALNQWYEEKHKAEVAEREMLKAIIDEKEADCDELEKVYKDLKAKSDALYAEYKKTKQEGKKCKAKYAEYKAAYAEYKSKKAEYEAKREGLNFYSIRYNFRGDAKRYTGFTSNRVESAMRMLFCEHYRRAPRQYKSGKKETQILFMTEKDQLPGIMEVTVDREDNTAYARTFVIIREDKD